MEKDQDYEVGFCKTPKHSRFKKGQSGNPKGRAKGHNNFKTDLLDTLKTPVQLKENGKAKAVSTQKAALMRLREKALSGDGRSLDRLLDLARIHNDEDLAAAAREALAPSDQALVDRYLERQLRREPKRQAVDDSAPADNQEAEEEEDDDAWLR